jgi:TonB family protein
MIMKHIDRSRSTRGGMTASFVIHGGLLLLLALVAGRQAAIINEGGELMEIAYIEAKYGEDVAAKVKIKEAPRMRPEPPGRGVNTDSAMKAPVEAPAAAPVEAPRPAPKPKPTMKTPVRVDPVSRPAVAKVDVVAPAAAAKAQQKTLAVAPQLATKVPRPKARQVIDSKRLPDSMKKLKADDAKGPTSSLAQHTVGAFLPKTSGLKNKSGAVALGQDVLATTTSSRGSAQVADAPVTLAAGGGLQSAGSASYQAPSAALAPAGSRSSSTGSKSVLDADGPSGGGGGKKSGRKTILNYGSGGGGRGGSLNGRGRIAEPAAKREIVAQAAPTDQGKQKVADVKLDAKGVNMTISGQIQGRKILTSVAPIYSEAAKKQGWEGVVAVHFTVKADGRVKDNMYFDQTSVHRDLNQAARAAIKQFVFAPLGSGQAAVEQWGVITIVFRLN